MGQVENRLGQLSPQEWEQVKDEGLEAAKLIAELMDRDPADAAVQEAVRRHHSWLEHFYPAPASVYLGLSEFYVEHEEFNSYSDGIKPGLAEFSSQAMAAFARVELS